MKPTRILLTGLLLAATIAGCGALSLPFGSMADPGVSASDVGPAVNVAYRGPGESAMNDGPTTGLQFRLGEGAVQPGAVTPNARPPAEPLSAADTEALLRRLPALPTGASDVQEFALPATSIPPPRTGDTLQEPFPPPAATPSPVTVAVEGLEVLRYSPDGDVPLAPNLSVTFNQAMVALTGLQDLAKNPPPVRVSPQPPGQWRWVGTKTLVFEPDPRFPMATQYTAEIPAGTASANGSELGAAVRWTFTTPPPAILTFVPSGEGLPLDPIMLATFDQRIDPEAVLATVMVQANRAGVPVRLATENEIKGDKGLAWLIEQAGEGRWLAFRAQEPLPPAADVSVSFGPGTPSAEGPLTTTTAQSFRFRTHGPLTITSSRCGWSDNCPPLMPWYIEFSNPLDPDSFTADMVRITPELPGAEIQVYGSTLQIQGRSTGRTKYQVRVSSAIRDVYEQTLGQDETVTFNVGEAEPVIWSPGAPFAVLDPSLPPRYSVFTINFRRLNVRAYAVTPQDWRGFRDYMASYYQEEKPINPPGKQVLSKTIDIRARADELVETAIDLSPALNDGLGQLVVVITPETTGLERFFENFGRRSPVIQVWLQATQIGLDAFVDATEMTAWASALTDGKPLDGVALELQDDRGRTISQPARSDDGGMATLALPAAGFAPILVGRLGNDTAILPANTSWWGEGGWSLQPQTDYLRWHVFDDRAMYRPGEEVHVKGWIRRIGASETGDVEALSGAAERVRYRIIDPQGAQIGEGTTDLSNLGGFDLVFTLPEAANLGYATLELTAQGGSGAGNTTYNHNFQVQEFRRPEFEVVNTPSEGPYFVGDSATVEVNANYYAGGPLPNADVTWQVVSLSGSYSPPGWDDFTFGTWTPWWMNFGEPGYFAEFGYESAGIRGGSGNIQTFTGVTDAAGNHTVRIDFESVDPPEPSSLTAEATVMDVNRQAWTARSNLLVHPASLYVGLRSEEIFVEREDPLRIEAIVTDLDGAPISGTRIIMKATRLAWRYKNGVWGEEEIAPQACTVESALQPVRCTFETPEGGEYRITAEITDPEGRRNRSQFTRWVSGGEQPPARQVEQEQVTLIPDRKEYQPGDTAKILVQAPFFPAEGVLTLRRSGILSTERFTLSEPTTVLQIPIEDAYIPNIYVQVDLSGSAPRAGADGQADPDQPSRPAFASGQLNLRIPALSRTLSVSAEPRDPKVEPGGETTVNVAVVDAAGEPVAGAEVAVVIVDEAVLALSGYTLPDPIATFYSERGPDASDYRLRAYTILGQPELPDAQAQRELGGAVMESAAEAPMAAMPAPMATMAVEKSVMDNAASGDAPPIAVRTDFNPLAVFAPEVVTGPDGKAVVEVTLPDNLTRYRIMATAVAGEKFFGKGESNLTARLPLMVRPSAPRFLNFGDRFELPVVLQNQTDAPLTVDVAVRAANVMLTDGAGRRVIVPANDRVEVRFPASTAQAGTARFQFAASSGPWADAAQVELPVWTPATTEAFATYGTIDEGAIAQPVIAPTGVFTQFGGLEVTTSSTALQELTDAFLYLQRYPFECSEQIASRMLSVVALRDVLSAFKAEGMPTDAEIEASMARDIKRLAGMQNADGGFPVWRRGDESWPFHSIHAANALQRARAKGYDVPSDTLARANEYLRNIESYYPSWYSEEIRQTLTAYALNVRALMGDRDAGRARRLINEAGLDNLPLEAVGWLLPVLSDDPASQQQVEDIRRLLNNRTTETAGAAHFVTGYGDDGYVLLHSDRRVDGIVLDALIGDQPDSDLIPKLVRGLLAHRTAGRWANTQENVFILLALDRYFNTYEKQTPDFVARMWLGEDYVGEAAFRGRTTDYKQVDVPMAFLAERPGEENLVLSKEGEGRLYYRLGLRYAPRDLNLPPADYGFTVERTYEAVDDPGDVRRDATGTWFFKAGARVRVKLTLAAPARRYHVALVDPLPAGVEALNPAFAVTGALPGDSGGTPVPYRWWWGPWYEHQNLRDERAEAFTSLLWDGVYTYVYYTRATTPGQFVVPPAKAEEMYAPETFGRSAGDRVVVE